MILQLTEKLLPLFFLILVGYAFARISKSDYSAISKLLMYVINPFIMFYAGYSSEISTSLIIFPTYLFIASCLVSLAAFNAGKFIYPAGSDKNLLAYTAGASNTGYFGLPLITAVLGSEFFNIAIVASLGVIIYEFTLGFYLAAKGNYSAKDSLFRLLKLPHLYSFFSGLLLNILQIDLPGLISLNFEYFKSAYILLGMMMIGFGLSSMKIRSFDTKFILLNLFAKSVLLPLATFLMIITGKYSGVEEVSENYHVLILLALTPVAANSVNFAKELGLDVGKAALTVMISTVIALVSIPLISSLILPYLQKI